MVTTSKVRSNRSVQAKSTKKSKKPPVKSKVSVKPKKRKVPPYEVKSSKAVKRQKHSSNLVKPEDHGTDTLGFVVAESNKEPPASASPESDAIIEAKKPTLLIKLPVSAIVVKNRMLIRNKNGQIVIAVKIPDEQDQTIDERPESHSAPPVWSSERGALDDTLWFHASGRQSAIAVKDGMVVGFLADVDSNPQSLLRSYMDGEVLIVRTGGGCGERGRNPDLVLSKCRSKDDAPLIHQQYRVDYLYTSMKRRVPIGLILGQGNVVCPTKIPHKYCVMDWFFVTHIWAEPCGGKLVHRFRLQKIDLATKSWWILKDSSDPASPFLRDYRTQIQVKTCANCGIPSPQIYKNNWFCTATHCPRFGKVWGGSLPRKLEFTDEFLQERAMYSPNCVMPRLQPFAISSVPVPQTAQQYFSRDAWRGRVCPICHGCMPRMIWEGYSCRTPNCGYFHEPELQIMPPKVCYGGLFNATIGHSWPDVRARIPGIVIERPGRKNHHWNIFEFDLSKGCTFAHLSSNLVENGRPGGSEDLFIALQRTRIGLSRRTMGGNSLTRHFAVNHGMHYKYHAHHGTTAFSQSPPVIHAALSQLQWAAKCVAGDEMDDINEVLTVAYFEDMKMNYHDDGESTVGNTIVSLSLGHAATMSFKMKDKIYNLHGLTKQNYDHTVPVIRGSKFWKEREGLNAEWVKLTNQAKSGRLNAIFKALEMDRKASPVLFEATLKFGDMMVMHGEAFQKIYDHAVIPQGGLRFALTGRHMKLSEFPKEEHWKGKIDIDPQYRYDPDHRHVRTIPEPEYHGPAAMPSPITTERASPQRQHPESPSNDFPGSGPQGSNDTSPSHSAGLLRTPESSGVAHSYDNAENASPISQSIHPPDTLDPQDVPDSFNPSKTTEISDLLVSSDVPNAIANAGPLNVSRCLSDSDLSEISERKMNDLESSVILANPDNLGGSVRMTTARKTLPKSRSEAQGSSIGMSGDDKDVDVHLEVNVSVEVPCAEPEFGDEQPMSSDH